MSAADPVTPEPRRLSIRLPHPFWIGLTVVALVAAVGLWYPVSIHQRQEREDRAKSAFRYVMQALVNYENGNHCLPVPVILDEDGTPRASWRLPITNFLDAQSEITYPYMPDSKRPWIWIDANQTQLSLGEIARRPNIYSFWEKSGASATRIAAVAGPGSAFDARNRCSFAEFDADTIILVEVANFDLCWADPGDYTWTGDRPEVASAESVRIGSANGRGFHVAFADYAVWFLSGETPIDELARFFTIRGAWENDRNAILGRYRL